MISAQQFLNVLEQKDLLPADLIRLLRERIAASDQPVTAIDVARRLIEMGRLTPPLAERLLTASYRVAGDRPSRAEPSQTPAAPVEGGLILLDDEDEEAEPPAAGTAQGEDEDLGLVLLEEDEQKVQPSKPSQPQPARKQAKKAASPPRRRETSAAELAAVRAGLQATSGPLDDLFSDAGLGAAATASPLEPVGGRGLFGRFFRRPRHRRDKWDSPLLLVGGGFLILLVLGGVALFIAISRQTAEEVLEIAHEHYRAGSYTQAIHAYGEYLRRFPNHQGVSLAEVRRGLAQIRQVVEAARVNRDWAGALSTTRPILDEIASEPDFQEARAELATLLPDIAEGLAELAREAPDPQRVAQARETLDLVDRYVLRAQRPVVRLEAIRASLALSDQRIAEREELEKALKAIAAAVDRGDPDEAYAIRRSLLSRYPSLDGHAELVEAETAISAAMRGLVAQVDSSQEALTDVPDDGPKPVAVLAQRSTRQTADGERVHFAMAAGAVYGLDGGDGRVLWQRPVGFATSARSVPFTPMAVGQGESAGAVLIDYQRQELVRLDARTGEIAWRFPLGEDVEAHPRLVGDRLLLATPSGRLLSVDAASGSSTGFVQFPQPLYTAPTVDTARGLVYQVAEHSNLFVVELGEGGVCRQVVHLGHNAGGVTAAPVLAAGYLVVAENDRGQDSLLHVLATQTEESPGEVVPVQQIRLRGRVDLPPRVLGRRILVTTDRGGHHVFEVGGTDPANPLVTLAEGGGGGEATNIRYAHLEATRFFVADSRFVSYDIQAARGRTVVAWAADAGSTFVQPPVAFGPHLFVVRRSAGQPGAFASLVAMDSGNKLWETLVAAPLASEPRVDTTTGRITALGAAGGIYQIEQDRLGNGAILDEPTLVLQRGDFQPPLAGLVELEGTALLVAPGPGTRRLAVFDPAVTSERFHWLNLPAPLASPPVRFGEGVIIPTSGGQVLLMDRRGNPLAEPFQPPLAPGETFPWSRPLVLPAEEGEEASRGGEVLLTDGKSKLYRLAVVDQPSRHLAARAVADLAAVPTAGPAVAGPTVYVVDDARQVIGFRLQDLERSVEQSLLGRCVWGPFAAGEVVLLATDAGRLAAFDGEGLRWEIAFDSRPVGQPLLLEGEILLSTNRGHVYRLAPADGREEGRISVGRALSSGPVVWEDRLLVATEEGSIFEVQRP